MSEVFGELFPASRVENAVIATLRKWLPTYVAEVRAQNEDAGKIEAIKSWGTATEFDRWPEQKLPALVVVAPGLDGDSISKDGDGYYSAAWSVQVHVVIAAATAPRARQLAQLYAAAVRGAMLQRRSLGDGLLVTDWVDEAYDAVPVEQRRSLAAAANVFTVEAERVVTWQGGPATIDPPDEHPEDLPEITDVDVAVTHDDV